MFGAGKVYIYLYVNVRIRIKIHHCNFLSFRFRNFIIVRCVFMPWRSRCHHCFKLHCLIDDHWLICFTYIHKISTNCLFLLVLSYAEWETRSPAGAGEDFDGIDIRILVLGLCLGYTGKVRTGRNSAELRSSAGKTRRSRPFSSDETCAVQGAPKSQRLVRSWWYPLVGYFCPHWLSDKDIGSTWCVR